MTRSMRSQLKHLMDGYDMTVAEVARRILDNNWEGVREINIQTLGRALSMVEMVNKSN